MSTTPSEAYQALKKRALHLLARREHSRAELKQKLATKNSDPSLLEHVLNECLEKHWLDELRFARLYLEQRAAKYYGPRKIRFELQRRGIPESIIEEAFQNTAIDWKALAEKTRLKKFGRLPKGLLEHARQSQFLYQRGFVTSSFAE